MGQYSVDTSAPGFQPLHVSNVAVQAGAVYGLPLNLSIAASSATVDVTASSIAIDTNNTTQSNVLESKAVQDLPLNGRDFTQLLAQTAGFSGYNAPGEGTVNGLRFDQLNWQIEGVDNNDAYYNAPATNQGGVFGIAGVVLPLDSIEEFALVTGAGAERAGGRLEPST